MMEAMSLAASMILTSVQMSTSWSAMQHLYATPVAMVLATMGIVHTSNGIIDLATTTGITLHISTVGGTTHLTDTTTAPATPTTTKCMHLWFCAYFEHRWFALLPGCAF